MRKILYILIFLIIFTACSEGGAGVVTTYVNDEIDKEMLDTIEILDKRVIDGLKNNNTDNLIEISSDYLKDNVLSQNEVIANINQVVKDKSFNYKDRYYSQTTKIGNYKFTIATFKDDPFYITVDAISKDIFVSLIKSNSNINDYLLTLIYVKNNDNWMLNGLYIGDYSCNGMTAIDLYEEAKLFQSKGFIIPAALYTGLSNKLLRPAPFLQYKIEDDITSFSKEVFESIKNEYVFPLELMNSNNEIYGFDIKCVIEGLVPVIKYTTSINLSNVEDLKKEANIIKKEVDKIYTGFTEKFDIFIYEAYSEPPLDSNKMYDCYRIVINE